MFEAKLTIEVNLGNTTAHILQGLFNPQVPRLAKTVEATPVVEEVQKENAVVEEAPKLEIPKKAKQATTKKTAPKEEVAKEDVAKEEVAKANISINEPSEEVVETEVSSEGWEGMNENDQLEAIRDVVTKVSKQGRAKEIRALLNEYKVNKASDLKPKDYHSFYQQVRSYGA